MRNKWKKPDLQRTSFLRSMRTTTTHTDMPTVIRTDSKRKRKSVSFIPIFDYSKTFGKAKMVVGDGGGCW